MTYQELMTEIYSCMSSGVKDYYLPRETYQMYLQQVVAFEMESQLNPTIPRSPIYVGKSDHSGKDGFVYHAVYFHPYDEDFSHYGTSDLNEFFIRMFKTKI